MKKLIALATLLFAFTLSANAQDKKVIVPEEVAKKDLTTLIQKLNINEDLQRDFYTLMVMKHEQLQKNPNMSAADKEKMGKRIEAKMISALNDTQKATFNSDPELKKLLTN
jgi:hypothetical protein